MKGWRQCESCGSRLLGMGCMSGPWCPRKCGKAFHEPSEPNEKHYEFEDEGEFAHRNKYADAMWPKAEMVQVIDVFSNEEEDHSEIAGIVYEFSRNEDSKWNSIGAFTRFC